MAHDDEAYFPNSSDPESATRSVAGSAPVQPEVSATVDIHDDDALADALAAEYTSMATSAIPIVPQQVDADSRASEDWVNAMVESGEVSALPDLVVAPDAPASEPPAHREPDVEPALADDPSEPEVGSDPAPERPTFISPFDQPTATVGTPVVAAAPWSLFPAPDPSHAVELDDGPPRFLAQSPVEDWPAPWSDQPETAPTRSSSESMENGRIIDPPVDERVSAFSDRPASAEGHVSLGERDASLETNPHEEANDGSVADPELVSTVPAWEPALWQPPVDVAAPKPVAETATADPTESDAAEHDEAEHDEAEHDAAEHDDSAHRGVAGGGMADDHNGIFDVNANPEDETQQFPWIAAAAAAAAAAPLVAPVDKDPFNWSITATGKVAYLDEWPADPEALQESVAHVDTAVGSEPQQQPEPGDSEEVPTVEHEPHALDSERDRQRMFSPPALIEPPASSQATAAYLDLPSAPPAYLPVDHPQIEVEADAATMGSISVIDPAYERELDDDVDDSDRAFANLLAGGAGAGPSRSAVAPPSKPISTVRLADNEPVRFDGAPIGHRVFSLEHGGLEPTLVDARSGHAVRLFWLWFSANSSIVSVALGAVVFAAGMSLRQSIIAILGGVALSFFPLALTTLAGKRSGQPTMVVSRATFGLLGNVVPAALAVVSRLFWGAVLLWLLGGSVAAILVTAGLGANTQQLALITIAIAFLIALLIAFIGFPLLVRMQLILTIVAVVLIVGLIALTAQYIDIPKALTVADGSWVLTVGGAVLVFSFIGLVWAHSGADLARYQRPASSGASSMLFATFGTAIPASVLIGYGALLAASDPGIATGFVTQPVQTLAGLLPGWYPVPLIAATALSLLSGVVVTLYSGGLALQSAGVKLTRQLSVVAVGAVLAGLAVLMTMTVGAGIGEVFRDFATTLAVPTAAWIGIFGSEMMIRNRRFDSESLLKRGGVYSDVRWINLGGFVLISAIGLGFTTATVSWLSWQGYAFPLVGVPLDGDVAGTDLGVIIALVLGLVLPLAASIPAIRRQESSRA